MCKHRADLNYENRIPRFLKGQSSVCCQCRSKSEAKLGPGSQTGRIPDILRLKRYRPPADSRFHQVSHSGPRFCVFCVIISTATIVVRERTTALAYSTSTQHVRDFGRNHGRNVGRRDQSESIPNQLGRNHVARRGSAASGAECNSWKIRNKQAGFTRRCVQP